MTLYEIKEKYLELLEMDLDEQTMTDTLESLQGDLEEKADNIACLIKSLEAEADAITIESNKLKERANQKHTKADSLKRYLYDTFKTLDVGKIETSRNVLQVKQNPESVEVDDEFIEWAKKSAVNLLSYEKPKPNKAQIKAELKCGVPIPGARLVRGERLVIK